MNPLDEGDSVSPIRANSSSSQSDSDAAGVSSDPDLTVSIGFSSSPTGGGFWAENPMSSSSAHNLFDVMPKPEKGASDPFSMWGSSTDVPQPLEGLHGQLVPPFLWKTFDLVEDPALDPIVSWGSAGQSFVVWDPVEFSRVILPSNFKHNNFSSFVRQLNTYVGLKKGSPTCVKGTEDFHLQQGFRKIDADKWEFANDAFQRGKRHLLKNIQRRKSPHSQQVGSLIGPSTGSGKSGLEDEIGRLKKERSMLMQEVVELQQEQKGTAQHVKTVNQRLQSAEQKQKQMISFLAKLLQNPEFLFRLQKKKEQRDIDSPRMKRKFVKQHQHETDGFTPFMEGQIVKYQPDWGSLATPELNPGLLEGPAVYLLQGVSGDLGSIPESVSNFQYENDPSRDVITSEELAFHHGIVKPTELSVEPPSNMSMEDQHSKGKAIGSPSQDVNPDYFVSLAESIQQFSHLGTGTVIKPEEIWSTGLNVDTGTSSSNTELWSNPVDFEDPFLQGSSGLSPFWDLGSLQAGDSHTNTWSASGFPFDDPDSRACPENTDDSEDK